MSVNKAANRPLRGLTAMGVFLFFGAAMAGLAAFTLLWRGTSLDRVWALNAEAYRQLAPLGRPAGVLFLLLSATLFAAGVGWFRRRRWGWGLAVFLIATQLAGNIGNILLGRFVEGAVGLAISGALLVYLVRPEVRKVFNSG